MVYHEKSKTLFLFGGIKQVTKEQNDVMAYLIESNRWIKIHSNTNDLYDSSPTFKHIIDPPTAVEDIKRKARARTNGSGTFKLGIKTVPHEEGNRMSQTNFDFVHTESANTNFPNKAKRKMSVVQ